MPYHIIKGDLVKIPVSVLIVPHRPFGKLEIKSNESIKKVAGSLFQALIAHYQTNHPVKGTHKIMIDDRINDHNGNFGGILFVVDMYESPLSSLIYSALQRAYEHNFSSIAMPIWREELVSCNPTTTSLQSLTEETKKAIHKFRKDYSLSKMRILVVSDNDQALSLLQP